MVKLQFTCETCGKEFSNSSVLKQHVQTHQPSKPWKCELCPRQFCQKSKLLEHVNRHQGTQPYVCGECGKGFYQKDRLKTHEFSHSNTRPFQCETCSLSFRRKYELNKHLKLHDSDLKEQLKKYVCSECGKKNYSLADLTRHALKHSNVREFTCSFCPKAFKDKYTLKCHEVIIHFPVSN
jgi:uncharacterized Zn-finger protein